MKLKRGSSTTPPRVLLVGMGVGGGIGRYELLVLRTLAELEAAGRLRFRALWRRPHPPYIRTGHHVESQLAAQTSSPTALAHQIHGAARGLRPDIVLFTHVNLARLAPVVALRRPRPRLIVAAHGIDVWTRLGLPKRAVLRAADRVVTVSAFTRERLLAVQGVRPERAVSVPLCLDPSWLKAGLGGNRGQDAAPLTRLLTVSRLDVTERAKGVDWVIRALPAVAQAVSDVSYTIVGQGDDAPRLQALARAAGVADRVAFKGALAHDQLVDEYRSCDAFVLPSGKEGFGLVFLEAMAFGKPVVARTATATPEVVEDGKTGVLVRTEPELAPALTALLLDRARASRMGAAGRHRALDEFSLETYRARMAAMFEELA